MGAIIPVGLRGLIWLATSFGLGSFFGGDKIATQTVISETKWYEKLLWILVGAGVVIGIIWLVRKLVALSQGGGLKVFKSRR